MKSLEQNLAAKVIGQEEAVKKVAKAIRRSRAGLKSKHIVQSDPSYLLDQLVSEKPNYQRHWLKSCLVQKNP